LGYFNFIKNNQIKSRIFYTRIFYTRIFYTRIFYTYINFKSNTITYYFNISTDYHTQDMLQKLSWARRHFVFVTDNKCTF